IALDFAIGTAPVGRLVIELYEGKTPKTCEQFAGLAIASASGASETWEPFDQIIPGILIRSGRVVGQTELGESPFEARFEEENLGWRKFDERGLVGIWGEEKDSARRPFFITLGPCPILNNKHTVFGRVVSDDTILDKIASVPIDPSNHPTSAIEVINCEIV
ncbi:cyclophilin-like protein, partial [Lojkania enalia]